jgi:hypothetical protein
VVEVAGDRWPRWAAEQAGTSSGPTGAGVLRLAVLVVLVVLVLQALPATDSGGQPPRPTTPPPCAQHWPPTCKEASGGR